MNCYESERIIKPFDLLVAEDTDFDLTRNRVYVAKDMGYGNFVNVVNDKGVEETYSTEYFRFYDGETIGF
ncbi:hypothetical protein [Bacillus sp. 7894-2]|uniref:hypothetical protein n=1 Tax=Bacillus sp. 7894-2 TaxID=2021695 RepID=UPI000BA6DEE4|nr:hypothetical protein [Bacillus sp. 7894-2]PAE24018.1 hypothetical protein CHI10_14530 [Bacillus sp. 7894-2]